MDGDVSIKQRKRKRLIAAALGMALASAGLAGCSSSGATELRFTFSKREAIDFMRQVVNDYNAANPDVHVVLDTSGPDVISGGFVRGNPPDLMLANYNHENSRFIQRCALSDLSDLPETKRVREETWPLMDAYGACPDGRISAIPYSLMLSGVIYNKDIFAQYDLEVPTTWDELIEVSDTLKDNGVDPFYATFSSGESWTIGQGWFDYTVISSIDVLDFFKKMNEEGTDVGPDSEVSYEKDFAEPVQKMRELADNYTNADARNRTYGDGNLAMAQGKAAMMMQGPWAMAEIAKSNPDGNYGMFPLPATNDPEKTKARSNTDLALMIPEDSKHKEEAREFLQYLYQPEMLEEYNASQLGFTPTTEAKDPTDPRIEDMVTAFKDGKYSEGPSVLTPRAIPVNNYTQTMILGSDPTAPLRTMDQDWVRLAKRG